MQNIAIRDAAAKHGVRFWEIAVELGIGDTTLTRWLRQELPEEKRVAVLDAIERIAKEKERE